MSEAANMDAPLAAPPATTLEVAPAAGYIIEDQTIKRTADWKDIAYHSVTAMIGAGVLGLPHALSKLGWAGGLLFLAFSFWVSWHTYRLLVLMHEVPDLDYKPGGGVRRLDRYDQLASYVLGPRRGKWALMPFQMAVLVGIAVTYTVVGGDSLAAFVRGVHPGGQVLGTWAYYLSFGAAQLLLSLLPSFDDLSLVSLLGAAMSVTYCAIAIVMTALARPPAGVSYDPAAAPGGDGGGLERFMGVCNAMSTMFFAYGGHNVALEIQATIPVDGQAVKSSVPAMMRGVNITFLATGLCYFGVAVLGFRAFGAAVPDNVLAAFGGERSWVMSAANLMVFVHVAAAYQVYTQPVFSLVEARLRASRCAGGCGGEAPRPLRLALRLVYVALVTLAAVVVPFFGALMGLVGAVAITPTTFLLPPLLWLLHKRPRRWGAEWSVNAFLVGATGAIGLLGAVGSVYIITRAWRTFTIFAS